MLNMFSWCCPQHISQQSYLSSSFLQHCHYQSLSVLTLNVIHVWPFNWDRIHSYQWGSIFRIGHNMFLIFCDFLCFAWHDAILICSVTNWLQCESVLSPPYKEYLPHKLPSIHRRYTALHFSVHFLKSTQIYWIKLHKMSPKTKRSTLQQYKCQRALYDSIKTVCIFFQLYFVFCVFDDIVECDCILYFV